MFYCHPLNCSSVLCSDWVQIFEFLKSLDFPLRFGVFGLRLLQLILLNNTTNVAKSDILTIYCHPLKGKIIPFPDLGFFCNKKSQLFWKSCNFLIFWSWIENFISRNTYCSRSLHFRGLLPSLGKSGRPLWTIYPPYSPTFDQKLIENRSKHDSTVIWSLNISAPPCKTRANWPQTAKKCLFGN